MILTLYRGESLSLDKVLEELPATVVRYSGRRLAFYLLLRHDATFYGSAMCVDFTAYTVRQVVAGVNAVTRTLNVKFALNYKPH